MSTKSSLRSKWSPCKCIFLEEVTFLHHQQCKASCFISIVCDSGNLYTVLLLSSSGLQHICKCFILCKFPVFEFARPAAAMCAEAANFRSQLLSRCAKRPHLIIQLPPRLELWVGGCLLRANQNALNGHPISHCTEVLFDPACA